MGPYRIYYVIYRIGADGNGETRLTRNGYDDVNPDWSPDGPRIVLSSSDLGGTWAIPQPFGYLCPGCRRRRATVDHQHRGRRDRPVPLSELISIPLIGHRTAGASLLPRPAMECRDLCHERRRQHVRRLTTSRQP